MYVFVGVKIFWGCIKLWLKRGRYMGLGNKDKVWSKDVIRWLHWSRLILFIFIILVINITLVKDLMMEKHHRLFLRQKLNSLASLSNFRNYINYAFVTPFEVVICTYFLKYIIQSTFYTYIVSCNVFTRLCTIFYGLKSSWYIWIKILLR